MLFAWPTLFSVPMAIGTECYCFPTFKDLLALPATPFLNGSAKVRAYLFLPNLFSILFELSGVKINLFCEELTRFLKAGCKDTLCQVTSKVFKGVLFTIATQRIHKFIELTALFSRRGAKIGSSIWLPNLFWMHEITGRWNVYSARLWEDKKIARL